MAMPVSTRTRGDFAANRFAPSRVVVPIAVDAADDHLQAMHETLHGHPPGARARGRRPARRAHGRGADIGAREPAPGPDPHDRLRDSNLRGSPVDLFLGGARIEASYPMGPRAGVPLNVTVMSYCGELHLGIHSDPAAVVDPDLFLDCLRAAFAELAALD